MACCRLPTFSRLCGYIFYVPSRTCFSPTKKNVQTSPIYFSSLLWMLCSLTFPFFPSNQGAYSCPHPISWDGRGQRSAGCRHFCRGGFLTTNNNSKKTGFLLRGIPKTTLLKTETLGGSPKKSQAVWLHEWRDPRNLASHQFCSVSFLLIQPIGSPIGCQ